VPSSLKPLQEQVVVVMGASTGIGRETARRLARRGARVVLSARSAPALASLLGEIKDEGGEAITVVADVAEFAQVEAVADQAVAAFGRLDTWIHLAATSVWAPVAKTSPEEFRRVVDVTLLGQVHGAMAALPHLRREGRGALIGVTSAIARRAFPLQAAYSASKRGAEGFLEALRVELRHEGVPIRVTNVLPATVNTPFFEKARTKLGVLPKGPPPVYQPSVVADALLYAAEHGPRDLVVGGGGRALLALQKLSPRLVDAVVTRTGFAVQRTDEPKGPTDDALFLPDDTIQRAEGRVGPLPRRRSALTWAATHKGATAGLAAAGGGALAAVRRAWASG
jgi:NAD(P)-dependent dehydrogenase (short-subunit alcohol dehydrogenase family)